MLEIINQKNMNFLFEISKKPRNISELAKRTDMAISNVSTLVSRLQREGVVDKTESDWNRGKCMIITLTEYGQTQVKLLKQILKNHKENKRTLTEFIESINPSIIHADAIIKIETTEKGGENGTEEH